jgi:hypothetical protein
VKRGVAFNGEKGRMNIKEITLEELELHSYFYEEGLSCLLHTILFVRAPGSVRPQVRALLFDDNDEIIYSQDAHCKRIIPLTYAKYFIFNHSLIT